MLHVDSNHFGQGSSFKQFGWRIRWSGNIPHNVNDGDALVALQRQMGREGWGW